MIFKIKVNLNMILIYLSLIVSRYMECEYKHNCLKITKRFGCVKIDYIANAPFGMTYERFCELYVKRTYREPKFLINIVTNSNVVDEETIANIESKNKLRSDLVAGEANLNGIENVLKQKNTNNKMNITKYKTNMSQDIESEFKNFLVNGKLQDVKSIQTNDISQQEPQLIVTSTNPCILLSSNGPKNFPIERLKNIVGLSNHYRDKEFLDYQYGKYSDVFSQSTGIEFLYGNGHCFKNFDKNVIKINKLIENEISNENKAMSYEEKLVRGEEEMSNTLATSNNESIQNENLYEENNTLENLDELDKEVDNRSIIEELLNDTSDDENLCLDDLIKVHLNEQNDYLFNYNSEKRCILDKIYEHAKNEEYINSLTDFNNEFLNVSDDRISNIKFKQSDIVDEELIENDQYKSKFSSSEPNNNMNVFDEKENNKSNEPNSKFAETTLTTKDTPLSSSSKVILEQEKLKIKLPDKLYRSRLINLHNKSSQQLEAICFKNKIANFIKILETTDHSILTKEQLQDFISQALFYINTAKDLSKLKNHNKHFDLGYLSQKLKFRLRDLENIPTNRMENKKCVYENLLDVHKTLDNMKIEIDELKKRKSCLVDSLPKIVPIKQNEPRKDETSNEDTTSVKNSSQNFFNLNDTALLQNTCFDNTIDLQKVLDISNEKFIEMYFLLRQINETCSSYLKDAINKSEFFSELLKAKFSEKSSLDEDSVCELFELYKKMSKNKNENIESNSQNNPNEASRVNLENGIKNDANIVDTFLKQQDDNELYDLIVEIEDKFGSAIEQVLRLNEEKSQIKNKIDNKETKLSREEQLLNENEEAFAQRKFVIKNNKIYHVKNENCLENSQDEKKVDSKTKNSFQKKKKIESNVVKKNKYLERIRKVFKKKMKNDVAKNISESYERENHDDESNDNEESERKKMLNKLKELKNNENLDHEKLGKITENLKNSRCDENIENVENINNPENLENVDNSENIETNKKKHRKNSSEEFDLDEEYFDENFSDPICALPTVSSSSPDSASLESITTPPDAVSFERTKSLSSSPKQSSSQSTTPDNDVSPSPSFMSNDTASLTNNSIKNASPLFKFNKKKKKKQKKENDSGISSSSINDLNTSTETISKKDDSKEKTLKNLLNDKNESKRSADPFILHKPGIKATLKNKKSSGDSSSLDEFTDNEELNNAGFKPIGSEEDFSPTDSPNTSTSPTQSSKNSNDTISSSPDIGSGNSIEGKINFEDSDKILQENSENNECVNQNFNSSMHTTSPSSFSSSDEEIKKTPQKKKIYGSHGSNSVKEIFNIVDINLESLKNIEDIDSKYVAPLFKEVEDSHKHLQEIIDQNKKRNKLIELQSKPINHLINENFDKNKLYERALKIGNDSKKSFDKKNEDIDGLNEEIKNSEILKKNNNNENLDTSKQDINSESLQPESYIGTNTEFFNCGSIFEQEKNYIETLFNKEKEKNSIEMIDEIISKNNSCLLKNENESLFIFENSHKDSVNKNIEENPLEKMNANDVFIYSHENGRELLDTNKKFINSECDINQKNKETSTNINTEFINGEINDENGAKNENHISLNEKTTDVNDSTEKIIDSEKPFGNNSNRRIIEFKDSFDQYQKDEFEVVEFDENLGKVKDFIFEKGDDYIYVNNDFLANHKAKSSEVSIYQNNEKLINQTDKNSFNRQLKGSLLNTNDFRPQSSNKAASQSYEISIDTNSETNASTTHTDDNYSDSSHLTDAIRDEKSNKSDLEPIVNNLEDIKSLSNIKNNKTSTEPSKSQYKSIKNNDKVTNDTSLSDDNIITNDSSDESLNLTDEIIEEEITNEIIRKKIGALPKNKVKFFKRMKNGSYDVNVEKRNFNSDRPQTYTAIDSDANQDLRNASGSSKRKKGERISDENNDAGHLDPKIKENKKSTTSRFRSRAKSRGNDFKSSKNKNL